MLLWGKTMEVKAILIYYWYGSRVVGHGFIRMADLSCYTQYCIHSPSVNISQGIHRTLDFVKAIPAVYLTLIRIGLIV